MIYDVSRLISSETVVWPGDQNVVITRNYQIGQGDPVNLGSILTTLHIGTHVDAPFHYLEDGCDIEGMALEPFIGLAIAINLTGINTVHVSDIEHLDFNHAKRLIIRTDSWKEGTEFPTDIPIISAELPAFLKTKGVLLLGVDVPSVDGITSKDLLNHRLLEKHGIHILESLNLVGVPDGIYELIALPLKIAGVDGSPVRAILRTL